tara:strand:- start:406 stop:1866 length:1461 start_codon:yes stop_codon:yes gene_type:complete
MVDPRAAAAKALADKATAYGPKAMGSGGQPPPEPPHQEPSLPGGPKPFDPAQDPGGALPHSAEQQETTLPDGWWIKKTGPLDPSPHAEQKHADQSQETAAGPAQTETPTSPEEVDWGAVEKLTESKKAAQKLAEQQEQEEAEAKAIEEARYKQMVEEGGYQSTQQAEVASKTEKAISDYLGQATGIPPEELQGQIAGLQAAGYDQMAKFAQQMAARGMGTSGLAGQGMGQIMTQTMLGIANLKFENSKLALEERMNKMKNFMAFYGNVMSEANKAKHLEEMARLEEEKFNYDKDQNAMADKWVAIKNYLALTGAESWDSNALSWAFEAMGSGMSPEEIAKWVSSDGTNVFLSPDAPEFPGQEGEVPPPPEDPNKTSWEVEMEKYMAPDSPPPYELGYPQKYTPPGGKTWDTLDAQQKQSTLLALRAKSEGYPEPPPGWQSMFPHWTQETIDNYAASGYGELWEKYLTKTVGTVNGVVGWGSHILGP